MSADLKSYRTASEMLRYLIVIEKFAYHNPAVPYTLRQRVPKLSSLEDMFQLAMQLLRICIEVKVSP